MGTGLGVARVHMQLWAELDVVAPAAEIAEQRLADSDAIAVVTIFHRGVYVFIGAIGAGRRWREATRGTRSRRA